MHRHGYKGRKFGREKDQRSALLRSQADSLFLNESITTTMPKAKTLRSYSEKLITKAKVGSLHSRRQILSDLQTPEATKKLVDEIAPKLASRTSGYLKIEKIGERRGDNALLAKLSFVDDLSKAKVVKPKKTDVTAKSKQNKSSATAKSSKADKKGKKK